MRYGVTYDLPTTAFLFIYCLARSQIMPSNFVGSSPPTPTNSYHALIVNLAPLMCTASLIS
eukprot:scaffold8683_cov79-Skeletonema_dohrnii-CCMP3373.AAC.4